MKCIVNKRYEFVKQIVFIPPFVDDAVFALNLSINLGRVDSSAVVQVWAYHNQGLYFSRLNHGICCLQFLVIRNRQCSAPRNTVSKISVSIHSFAVNFIQISSTGLKEFDLCRKNIVLHAGNRFIIILFFHCIYHEMVSSDHRTKLEFILPFHQTL